MRRDAKVVNRFKSSRKKAGTAHCDVCGWKPPEILRVVRARCVTQMLQAHHVVPVSLGGLDEDSNLVLVCPTCHMIAQAVASHHVQYTMSYVTPSFMLESIRLLIDDPDAWYQRWMKEKEEMRGHPSREADKVARLFRQSQDEVDTAIRRMMVTKSATNRRHPSRFTSHDARN